jgi:hypothetical protein
MRLQTMNWPDFKIGQWPCAWGLSKLVGTTTMACVMAHELEADERLRQPHAACNPQVPLPSSTLHHLTTIAINAVLPL